MLLYRDIPASAYVVRNKKETQFHVLQVRLVCFFFTLPTQTRVSAPHLDLLLHRISSEVQRPQKLCNIKLITSAL